VQRHQQELASLETTRFLKVHARAWQILQDALGLQATVLKPDALFLHGEYLYSDTKRADFAVKCQNTVYVKYPKRYAVLNDENDNIQVGVCETTESEEFFATLCDCRTYNALHPNVLRKAYTPANRRVLNTMGHNTVQVEPAAKWHPAQEDKEDTWAFIAKNLTGEDITKLDWRLPFKCVPRPLIKDSVTTPANCLNMYTLPDIYTTDADKIAACENERHDSAGLLVNEDFLQKLRDANESEKLLLWNGLRASTHFIQTEPADPVTKAKAKVLEGTDCIRDALLRERVAAIQAQLLPTRT